MVEKHKPIYSAPFTTCEFRVSYPAVFEPRPEMSDPTDLRYSMQMIFEKDADLSSLKNAIQQISSQLGWEKGKFKSPLQDGNEKFQENPQANAALEGKFVAKAKSKNQPGIVDRAKRPILNPNEFFGGCYARAQLVAVSYVFMGQKGITLQLQNIQKLRDGEPFGRVAQSAEDAFDSVSDPTEDSFSLLD